MLSGHQGAVRFIAQRGQVGVTRSHIGRVRQREVEALSHHSRPPVAPGQRDRQVQRHCVAACDVQGGCAGIDCGHRGGSALVLDCQRDRATAAAQVNDARCTYRRKSITQQFQPPLDQQFGLWSRNQYLRSDLQREPAELCSLQQVSQWLPSAAAVQPMRKLRGLRGVEHGLVMSDQPAPWPSQQMRQHQLSVEPLHAGRASGYQGLGDGCARRQSGRGRLLFIHRPPLSSKASCSAALAACRAAVTSSRSPSMMACSLYSVRLIR